MSDVVTIDTRARSSSSAVRTHEFPVLESGNLSYPDGRYSVEFLPGKDRVSFTLTHRVTGASLLSRLLEEGRARYLCAVSSPLSSYRQIHLSKESVQCIAWDIENLGEPPLFTPMIVAVVDMDLRLDRHRDGVHDVWDGQRIRLEKGNRLALGHVIQLQSSILHLLSFDADPSLEDGRFFVSAEEEQGFRFRVKLSPLLHQFLRHPAEDGSREHIMTHIVTACLALLQREYQDDSDEDGGWKSHRNLCALANFMKDRNVAHWADDDFRPEEAATGLYPHALPPEHDGEDA